MVAALLIGVLAQQIPEPEVSPLYLAAWVTVAFIAGTPGVLAAVLTSRNRKELETVRHEVMPNGGSSSFDLLHRLAWETHERAGAIPLLVERVEHLDRRVDDLELTPCPFQPSED